MTYALIWSWVRYSSKNGSAFAPIAAVEASWSHTPGAAAHGDFTPLNPPSARRLRRTCARLFAGTGCAACAALAGGKIGVGWRSIGVGQVLVTGASGRLLRDDLADVLDHDLLDRDAAQLAQRRELLVRDVQLDVEHA